LPSALTATAFQLWSVPVALQYVPGGGGGGGVEEADRVTVADGVFVAVCDAERDSVGVTDIVAVLDGVELADAVLDMVLEGDCGEGEADAEDVLSGVLDTEVDGDCSVGEADAEGVPVVV
jgi:hypothetical protein